jgi:hypothetical protein
MNPNQLKFFLIIPQKVRIFEKIPFLLWEPGGGKNARKIKVLLLRGALRGDSFNPTRARCGPHFTSRGRRVEAKRHSEICFNVLAFLIVKAQGIH